MKYSDQNSSTLFCEQVSTVTSLFEKWNDCERTVVMYALLKRLRYPSLKFLQYSIENNLTQSFGSQASLKTVDANANKPALLQKLVNLYKKCPAVELSQFLTDNDPIITYGSDLQVDGINGKYYQSREEILQEVLGMLPLLRPGNDEAKAIYLSLIPIAVEDTVRQRVPTEIVQQIFSYLLIHPAITSDERKSLSYWLQQLEDHIQASFNPAGQKSFYVLSNNGSESSSNSNSTSMSSVGSASSNHNQNSMVPVPNPWQTIAPPSQSLNKQAAPQTTIPCENTWNVPLPSIGDALCDEVQTLVSSQNSLINVLTYDNSSTVSNNNNSISNNKNANNQNDDHHVSFSKNGTEIIDFDTCDSNSGDFELSSFLNLDHFDMHRLSLDSRMAALKTRRSNSLTTAISSSSSSNSSVVTVNDNFSNSSENLALYAQKPRSYSLSIEHPRGSLTSSESESRLDESKPNYMQFQTHNVGMSNIGQWLKSLRLHKYISLFTNMNYEEMLEITEDYLQGLGVTKGASHKLAMCIEKLNGRYSLLVKMEEELIMGKLNLTTAVEELTNIVLTPMKPADASAFNIAMKFLKVLDLVCYALLKIDSFNTQEEECVTVILWILDRSIHADTFLNQMNHLKEQKFKMTKLKMTFIPKNHHNKNGSNGNLTKPRWTSKRKSDVGCKTGSNDRIYRKNSADIISFSLNPQTTFDSDFYMNSSKAGNNNNSINSAPQFTSQTMTLPVQPKSSSYPNFKSSYQPVHQHQMSAAHKAQQFAMEQAKAYRNHRHSLSNIVVPQLQQQTQKLSYTPSNGVLSNTDCANRRSSLSNAVPANNNTSTNPSVTSKAPSALKPLEKTMAAVVLVSNNNNNTTNNNNSILCNSNVTNNKANLSISNSNFIIPPSLVKEKSSKSSSSTISDIKSLEHLDLLCLQMTEQAIN